MTQPEQVKAVKLLREWRDARKAVFKEPTSKPELWGALGNAEKNLMDFAISLDLDGV